VRPRSRCLAWTRAADIDRSLDEPAWATNAAVLTGDILLSYRPNPGTILFLGYGATMEDPDAFEFRHLKRDEDRFFMKLTYLFGR